jgi:hypothetical protein
MEMLSVEIVATEAISKLPTVCYNRDHLEWSTTACYCHAVLAVEEKTRLIIVRHCDFYEQGLS